jgi:hypothetical protein
MAIFPMLIAGEPPRCTSFHAGDDLVVDVQPVAPVSHGLRPLAPHAGDATDPDYHHAA